MVKNTKFYIPFLLIIVIYGCASIKTPEGGPRDKTPPKAITLLPKNLTTRFTGNKIVIEFDEYIKLANEIKEFSISPEQEKPPILKVKLKTLTITLQDSLEKNTTYTLNFGKSITDNNEGNVLKNFTYVFSTGETLDSLSISGKVKSSTTLLPELDVVIMAVPLSRDTIFGKRKPSIYTLTDSSGNYKLSNLRKDQYKIYAIKEKSGDRVYQQVSDETGFIKNPITLDKNIDSVNLLTFKELAKNFRVVDRRLTADGSITMSFNQNLRKPEIEVIEPKSIDANKFVRFNRGNDSVSVWLNDLTFDSIKVTIKDQGKPLDTIKFTRGKKDTYQRVIQSGDNLEGQILNPYRPLKLTFNLPIENIDINKVMLLEDSIPRKGFTLTKDSSDFLTYELKYPWKKKEQYILKFNANSITGFKESKNKEIIKTFTLGNSDDYANLTLLVKVPDTAKSYIIQLVNEKKELVISNTKVSKNSEVSLTNIKPGNYFVRVVYDENKNGFWDTGDVSQSIQPEKVWFAPFELSLKANWTPKNTVTIPL